MELFCRISTGKPRPLYLCVEYGKTSIVNTATEALEALKKNMTRVYEIHGAAGTTATAFPMGHASLQGRASDEATRWDTPPRIVGSVSTATCNARVIARKLADAYVELSKQYSPKVNEIELDVERTLNALRDKHADHNAFLIDIFEAIDSLLPPNWVCGSHPGDGADVGIWGTTEDCE